MTRFTFNIRMVFLGSVLFSLTFLVGCASQHAVEPPVTETSQATELPAASVPLPGETPSLAPTTNMDEAYLVAPAYLVVRSGPGSEYGSPLTFLKVNTKAAILGVSTDGGWWQIECPEEVVSPGGCWVSSDNLYSSSFNTRDVPVVSPPPTSIPTSGPRTLTICMGAEPDTLFVYYGAMLAKSQILQAIYDGPIDNRGYAYQPVILEKLPNLVDGDALIQPVPVQTGDRVLNDAGEVVTLEAGEKVRPYGCNHSACAIEWDGSSALHMAQLSATFTLLEGIRWSDGEPLTAADSYFGYDLARSCTLSGDCFPYAFGDPLLERTADYAVLDELTTRWVGIPGFLDPSYQRNFFHPLPEHQLGHLSAAEIAEDPMVEREPLGWGAYKIDEYKRGEYIQLSPNPYYFRADEGLPRFDRLVYRFTGASIEILSWILSGKCDIVEWEASSKSFEAEYMHVLLEA